jgi:cytoskeletal protein CcmA (bactofilin family)
MNFAASPATPSPPLPTSASTPAGAAPAPATPAHPAAASPSPAASVPPAPLPPLPPLTGASADVGAARHDVLRVLDWTVRGASKVLGDATVGFARIRGVATVGGKLAATEVTVRGTLNVLGTTEVAHRFAGTGTARFSASVRSAEFASNGRTVIEGDLRAARGVELTGNAEVSGNLEAASLHFRGTLTTPGAVRLAGDLHATLLEGRSHVGLLVARGIWIVQPRFPPWRTPGTLQTLRIEGTEVHLEGVVAEFVKGDAIHLGPGCRISRVEGPVVERHKDAFVGPSAVSEDIPAGLWR